MEGEEKEGVKMEREWVKKVIKLGDSISYVTGTKEYGRAEFSICPVFKRGYIRECYIYPYQQGTNTYYQVVIPPRMKLTGLYFGADPDNPPRAWMTFWCKEHKCHAFLFYVPRELTSFVVEAMAGTLTLTWARKPLSC